MARVASCPQCEHDLLVPDDAQPSALVKCPQCRAFFELQHAASRELPAALVVQSHPEPSAPSVPTIQLSEPTELPTLDDFSSLASLQGELEPVSESETVEFELKDDSDNADILDFADEEPTAEYGSPSLRAPQPPQLVDGPEDSKQPPTESHEEAAQRIDQWFRSAKTLSDLPPLDLGNLAGHASSEMVEPISDSTDDVTVEFGSDAAELAELNDEPELAELASDFDLETPADSPNDAAAPWDDSQHMDRLLADLEGESLDTYEPAAYEPVAHEHDEVALDRGDHEEHEHFQPAADWTPDESLAIPTAPDQPERKRSVVRTLVGSAVGGIFGLALAYYALLWSGPILHRDKDVDFLQLAQYLPKAILPPAFRKEAKQPPAMSPKMATDLAASDQAAKTEEPKPVEPAAAPAPAAPADSTAQTPVAPAAPAEKQATFTAPAEPAKKSADTDDRYASPAAPAAKSEPAMREPAPLEAPPAKAITDTTPKAEPIHIANAPSYSAADVSTSLAAANAAEAGLEVGSLQDGKEVAHTKGVSYMAIADFAQKATFADSADAKNAQQQSDDFFRKLLSNAHTRDEVAQIVPRWLSHPKRPQNGVFLAGNLKHVDVQGSVAEYTIELNGGPAVIVVVPATDKSIGEPKGPIAVVGSIIDKPSADVPGYTGKAPQVVFANKLLPLE